MNRKQLREFVRNRASVALERLSNAFFLQKCSGGYKYREQLKNTTDIELAGALINSRKEVEYTLTDLIALQAVCERSKILGGILIRRHKKLVAELDRDAAEILKARRQRKAEEERARAIEAAKQEEAARKAQPHQGAHGGGPS